VAAARDRPCRPSWSPQCPGRQLWCSGPSLLALMSTARILWCVLDSFPAPGDCDCMCTLFSVSCRAALVFRGCRGLACVSATFLLRRNKQR
jgi:hypothetical protein